MRSNEAFKYSYLLSLDKKKSNSNAGVVQSGQDFGLPSQQLGFESRHLHFSYLCYYRADASCLSYVGKQLYLKLKHPHLLFYHFLLLKYYE